MRHLLASFLWLLFTLYCNSAFLSSLEVVATIKPIHSLVASVTDGIPKPRMLAHTISAYDWSHLLQVIWNQMTSYCTLIIWKRLLNLSLKTIQNLQSYQRQSIYFPLDLIRFPGKPFELKMKRACMFGCVQKMQRAQCNTTGHNYNATKAVERLKQEWRKPYESWMTLNIKNIQPLATVLNHPSVILPIEEDAYRCMKSLMKMKKVTKEDSTKP